MSAVQIDFQRIEHERAALLEGPWTAALRQAGTRVETRLLVGDPIASLLTAADQQEADMIVIGTTGHGTVGDFLLGSTAMKFAHKTTRPLVLIP
jgi:nucleotide-binding universal stress UspA family protein